MKHVNIHVNNVGMVHLLTLKVSVIKTAFYYCLLYILTDYVIESQLISANQF